jgi:hypothetical protein
MPKIDWKSAAIGAAAVYGFLWWQAKKAKPATAST